MKSSGKKIQKKWTKDSKIAELSVG